MPQIVPAEVLDAGAFQGFPPRPRVGGCQRFSCDRGALHQPAEPILRTGFNERFRRSPVMRAVSSTTSRPIGAKYSTKPASIPAPGWTSHAFSTFAAERVPRRRRVTLLTIATIHAFAKNPVRLPL